MATTRHDAERVSALALPAHLRHRDRVERVLGLVLWVGLLATLIVFSR